MKIYREEYITRFKKSRLVKKVGSINKIEKEGNSRKDTIYNKKGKVDTIAWIK